MSFGKSKPGPKAGTPRKATPRAADKVKPNPATARAIAAKNATRAARLAAVSNPKPRRQQGT